MAMNTSAAHTLLSDATAHHGRRARRGFRITDRDRRLLEFVAAQRFVLACHAHAFMGCDRAVAYRRLDGLRRAGLLSYERIFHAQPGIFQITHGGLGLIDSPLPRPAIDLRCYRHDVGAVWVWLAAHAGRYGPGTELWSERQLRSEHQRRPEFSDDPFAIELDGRDRAGRPRVHLPDVLVLDADGQGTALELELSVKSRRRLETILLGYGCSPRVTRVIYLTDRRRIAELLQTLVSAFGLDGRISVHYLCDRGDDPQWWLWPSITAPLGGRR